MSFSTYVNEPTGIFKQGLVAALDNVEVEVLMSSRMRVNRNASRNVSFRVRIASQLDFLTSFVATVTLIEPKSFLKRLDPYSLLSDCQSLVLSMSY
jgi:hypothetical protein